LGTLEYVLISKAKTEKKGSIIVKVVGVGAVDSGTGSSGEWKKQVATVQDNSGQIDMVIWGEDIGKLDQGKFYKIETPFWKLYKDEVQLSLGKYAKVHLTEEIAMLPGDGSAPTPTVTGPEVSTPTEQAKLPTVTDALKDYVLGEDNLLLQIGDIVEENHKAQNRTINGQKIGMHTKEIYNQAKKSNFTKASKI